MLPVCCCGESPLLLLSGDHDWCCGDFENIEERGETRRFAAAVVELPRRLLRGVIDIIPSGVVLVVVVVFADGNTPVDEDLRGLLISILDECCCC